MNAPTQLLDINAVLARTGTGRTKHYEDIKLGLLPKPIKRGDRFARWSSVDIDAIVMARVAGQQDAEIKRLVEQQAAVRASATFSSATAARGNSEEALA